jgi:putative phosphoesterase
MTKMRLAVFSDIHSNILALNEVLADIQKQNCDAVYCLGDLVGYGPRPNEVIENIKAAQRPTVMGNYDEGVGFEKGDCGCAYTTDVEKANGAKSIKWTTEKVTSENKKYLRSLHSSITFNAAGYRILLVHGSPRRINEYIYEDRPERSLTHMLESVEADIVVCGHTHKPYHRIVGNVHLVNDGSVGKPKDGDPRACYAVIDLGEDVSVEFRRIEYPVERVADEVVKAGLPTAFAEALRDAGK